MTVGFESFTPDGKLQFSANAWAMRFTEKGSITTQTFAAGGQGGSTNAITYGQAQAASDFDMIAFRCSTRFCLASTYTLNSLSGAPARTIYAVTETGLVATVDYWCFKSFQSYVPPANMTGLQLYNADGTVGYSSNIKPMIVVDNHTITGTSNIGDVVTLPVGRDYAIIQHGTIRPSNGSPLKNNMGIKFTSQNVYTIAEWSSALKNTGAATYNGGFLAVDVTGY